MTYFTYFINDGIYTKIGRSIKPEEVMSELQSGNARKLKLLEAIPHKTIDRASNSVKRLHRQLIDYQVSNNGWFILSDDQLKILTKHNIPQLEKGTEISNFLKEQLSQGTRWKDLAKVKKELFVTNCINCNKIMELEYRQLTSHADNLCQDCRIETLQEKRRDEAEELRLRKAKKRYHRQLTTISKSDNTFLRKYYKHTARRMHKIRYDYSEKITIFNDNIVATCPEHGIFTLDYIDHIHGEPCPQCPTQPHHVVYQYLTTDDELISNTLPLKAVLSRTTEDHIFNLAQIITGPGSHKETLFFDAVTDITLTDLDELNNHKVKRKDYNQLKEPQEIL